MAQRHDEILAAGARVIGISVDPPEMQSAMVKKLELPFPLLSDPDRSRAIDPFGLSDPIDKRNIAVPATIVIGPDGDERYRTVGRDFADRPMDDEILAAVADLDLPPTTQDAPRLGPAEPSKAAFKVEQMVPYYRGARFAAIAMARRYPEAKADAAKYTAQMDVYTEAAKDLYKRQRSN
ncbi:MAG: redoxin domain-containing protein [Acidimicrobiia bacterium]|nr:redoxin domain-containing protein [Acidimicrobiia bacterium]